MTNATEIAKRTAAADFPAGTLIGSYRIDALIGEGGMGVVYRATDTKLNRAVAIKFLSEELFDADARRRFQREAQMASALNHPHILTVYDVGEHAGRQYLVTELIDGGTLQTWAAAEPRKWRQVVELLVGIADALATAHAANILHRDIKPDNILISKSGYAKLADFGIAKLVGDGSQHGSNHTAAGVVIGTVPYMSPEQASGRPLDPRSDIFTFGVLLYELLARRRPFEGNTDLETLRAVIGAEPLSAKTPTSSMARARYGKVLYALRDASSGPSVDREVPAVELRRQQRRYGGLAAHCGIPPSCDHQKKLPVTMKACEGSGGAGFSQILNAGF